MYNTKFIDRMDDSTNWTALGNDTTNLADSSVRILGKYSLEFDKADGTDNSTIAGAYRTISLDVDTEGAQLHDKLQWTIYLSALTNVANCFVKLGTDATNNNQYLVADTSLRTGWTLCTAVLGEPYAVNGTGWNPNDIKYMQVGVTFDAETDDLADIKVDSVVLVSSRYTEDNTVISMDGVSVEANLDALEVLVAASNVLLGTIDADTGAVKTATELIDDAIVTDEAAHSAKSMQVAGHYAAAPVELTDDDAAAILIDAFRRIQTANHDGATGTGLVTDLTSVSGVPFAPGAVTALAAAGNVVLGNVDGYLNHIVSVTIAAIDTSVTYHIEGSLDGGTVYDNVAEGGVTETETANDTLLYKITGPFTHLRLVFDSEVGGAAVTLTGRVRSSN